MDVLCMVVSMTGFGRSKITKDSFSVSVEVKTVNHRFTEFNIRMPRQFNKIEDKIKKKLISSIHRGRIEVFVTIEGEGIMDRHVRVDWELLDQYVHSLEKIKQKYALIRVLLYAIYYQVKRLFILRKGSQVMKILKNLYSKPLRKRHNL